MFDVTSRASFEALPKWLEEARAHGAPGGMVRSGRAAASAPVAAAWARDCASCARRQRVAPAAAARASLRRTACGAASSLHGPLRVQGVSRTARSVEARRATLRAQVVAVAASKVDCSAARQVPLTEAQAWAASVGCPCFEARRGPRL